MTYVLTIGSLKAHRPGSACLRQTKWYGTATGDLPILRGEYNRPRKKVQLCGRCFPAAPELPERTDLYLVNEEKRKVHRAVRVAGNVETVSPRCQVYPEFLDRYRRVLDLRSLAVNGDIEAEGYWSWCRHCWPKTGVSEEG